MKLPDDLNLLMALEVLLEERHVTRAALRLGLTQSAMSQRLGRLRAFFDDPLLVTGRPTMKATPRAEAIAGPLARAFADLRAAVESGSTFDPSQTARRFVMLGGDLVESYALPNAMAALDAAPRVTLSVERVDPDFPSRLELGTADVAFVPAAFAPPTLRSFTLPPARFVVLMRREHPVAKKKLTLARYLAFQHVLVAPRGLPGSLVDAALAAQGQSRRVKLTVQHFTSAPFLLLASDLLLTCPETVAHATAAQLGLRVAALPVALTDDDVRMVWHERAHRDPGHQWLRGLVVDTVRGAGARRGRVAS